MSGCKLELLLSFADLVEKSVGAPARGTCRSESRLPVAEGETATTATSTEHGGSTGSWSKGGGERE